MCQTELMDIEEFLIKISGSSTLGQVKFYLFIFPSLFAEVGPKYKHKNRDFSLIRVGSKHFAIKTEFLKLLKLLKSLIYFTLSCYCRFKNCGCC